MFSRHLHGASGVLGTPPAIPPTPLVFNNGFFQFEINQKQYVVSYWTPIAVLPNLVYPPLPEAPPALPNQTLDGSAEVITPPQPTAKILGLQAEEVMPSAEPMALGCVLSESNSVLLEYPESGHAPVHLHLEGIVGALKTWEATEVPPKHFEAQVGRLRILHVMIYYLASTNTFSRLCSFLRRHPLFRFFIINLNLSLHCLPNPSLPKP